ncbi:hypothetical protein CLV29_2139 [Naumannella halotolerans]|uniref:Uncharacterized protein n=1 Tax=Naumannella halotolerans TaxID=993414 RepID=A0A4R7JCR9_9ACTN|nr:hypothetical protein CLV29_2139 [Naumannella halotolerans]
MVDRAVGLSRVGLSRVGLSRVGLSLVGLARGGSAIRVVPVASPAREPVCSRTGLLRVSRVGRPAAGRGSERDGAFSRR